MPDGTTPYVPLTLVTVAFESELQLLVLHARSLSRHLDPGVASRIIVIDNTARGFSAAFAARLRAEYGWLASILTILRRRDVGDIPNALGWYVQQILKLQVAQLIETERYVVFDTKNLAVGRVCADFFEDSSGRPRGIAYSFSTHPHRAGLERVLEYVDVDPAPFIERFTATITPFVLETERVLRLMSWVQERSGQSFAREFLERGLLEFFLYSAFIVSHGEQLDDAFALDRTVCPTVWPRSATVPGVRHAIEQVEVGGASFMSVHRRAIAALDSAALDELRDFWIRSGLFDSTSEFANFVARYRAEITREERRRKFREFGAHIRRRAGFRAGRSRTAR